MSSVDPILDHPTPHLQRRIWEFVSRFPLRSLWNLEGIPVRVIVKHTWRSLLDDNLAGRAAELGFYFIFALSLGSALFPFLPSELHVIDH